MNAAERASNEEAAFLAANLAHNCGYAVFPCRSTPENKDTDKTPTCPHGFKDATNDPAQILELWRRFPGPLIGIATGSRSNVSVLDADRKHREAIIWWQAHCHRLLPTRTYETQSGGLHLYFQHRPGIANTQSKICQGVDTRGEGGYAISWFAAGCGCFDHTAPAPWPDWLHEELTRPPAQSRPVTFRRPRIRQDNDEPILRRVANAVEGERNGVLFWAANRLRERGTLKTNETELLAAARTAGLPDIEVKRTVASAGRQRS